MPANKPDSLWVFENCLIPDLKTISPAKDAAFYTELKGNVIAPDFSPENETAIWERFTHAAILCWFRALGDSVTVSGGVLGEGRRRRGFRVFFMGGLKADRDRQAAAVALAEDHFRVMDKNPQRTQPGGTTPYAINTILAPDGDYQFHWERLDQGLCAWSCSWIIDLGESA